ncbi:MAG: enoyl-CoA hydratase-related protein [Solirubrobacterales bacterium]
MADEPLVIRRTYEGVETLQLNRPEARNALSEALRSELIGAVEAADSDPDIRCVLIAGNDDYFAAGADIHALRDRDLVGTLDSARGRNLWQTVGSCTKPVIAAVSGYALGGGFELVLACDIVIASETAQFGTPEVTLGIIPGGGGTQRLARVIGKQKAMELVLTGRRISAFEARDLGLVNEVVPKSEQWLEKALDLALVIARRPPIAVRMGKQAVVAAEEMPLTAGLAYERRLFEIAMSTDDRVEGMTAFIEKRPPRFEGH